MKAKLTMPTLPQACLWALCCVSSGAGAQDKPHVYLGRLSCEMNQVVSLQEVPNAPGQYQLNFKKSKFKMLLVSSNSGAVRLEDPFTGTTWVQLNSKSMLMDNNRGVRLVDDCQHPTQKAMAEAMKSAPPPPLIEVDTSTR
jgi:hypothetical protein